MAKDEHVRFRISSSDKVNIERAAAQLGMSVSMFMRTTALERAAGLSTAAVEPVTPEPATTESAVQQELVDTTKSRDWRNWMVFYNDTKRTRGRRGLS